MTLSFEAAQRGIVQIRSSDDSKPVGTGFFVAGGYILTCAHVVRAVLTNPTEGDELDIRVFREDSNRRAVVVSVHFEEKKHDADVALLRLIDTPPEVQIAPRQQLSGFDDAICLKIFGYSSADGLVIDVVAQGQLDGAWVQLDGTRTTGGQIEDGFSGAPVWCPKRSAWVGMVVAREEYRETDRIGYMIPEEQLTRVLHDLRADSLYNLLAREKDALSLQIQRVYAICRADRKSGLTKGLKEILRELSIQGTVGTSDKRLVLFATGLFLDHGLTRELSQSLSQWLEGNTSRNLSELCDDFRQLQVQEQLETIPPADPGLWILVQANNQANAKNSYQIDGFFVPDPKKYDAKFCDSKDSQTYSKIFRKLANQKKKERNNTNQLPASANADKTALTEEAQSWCHQYLRDAMRAYFTQLEDMNVDLEELTVEIFLPTALMNEGIELIQIPSEIGNCWESITQFHGVKVRLRSQRRLTMRSWRSWEKKWLKLKDDLCQFSSNAFVTSENENSQRLRRKLKSALGFKLDYSPDTSEDPENKEIGAILATGIPAVLWVRCDAEEEDWQGQIDQEILTSNIADIPQTVATLRQDATPIEEVENIEESSELGHRLSFMWENPRHVPPIIYYSDDALL